LLAPSDGAQLFGQQRFIWQWDGPSLGGNQAFDLRIWSQQEQQAGRPRRGAVPPTQDTEAEVDLQFVPAIKDYGAGDYYWTVVVVETASGGSPRVVGTWGEERRFSYGTGTPTQGPTTITSPEPPNQAPVARFGYECSGLKCDFDGSASFDPDGSIVSHSWSFGDGEGGNGQTTGHKFKNAGSYTVVLTVTDNQGATNAQSRNVKVP
jgi:chitodextrinase